MIRFLRFALIILPALAFIITKRICLSLQRRDREKLLHGRETGRILRLPTGEFIEVHEPVNSEEKALLESKPDTKPLPEPPETDSAGVRNPKYKSGRRAAGLSRFLYRDTIEKPTEAEMHHGEQAVEAEDEFEAPLLEREEAMHIAHDGSVLAKPVVDAPESATDTEDGGSEQS